MVHKAYKLPPKWAPASDGKSRARPMFTGLLNGLLVLDPASVCCWDRESLIIKFIVSLFVSLKKAI